MNLAVGLSAPPTWRSDLVRTGPSTFEGYVHDRLRPGDSHVVELLVDGLSIACVRADRPLPRLAAQGLGDGSRGFVFALAPGLIARGAIVEARIANTIIPVGHPIALADPEPAAPGWRGVGQLVWEGGLRVRGWLNDPADDQSVRLYVDGDLVDEILADRHVRLGESADDRRIGRGFLAHLPERFADGHVHRVEAVSESGLSLDGGPLPVLAFADDLAVLLNEGGELDSQRPRAAFFDLLFPLSMPLSRYAEWKRRFAAARPADRTTRVGVVFTGAADATASVASLEAQAGCEWVGVCLPHPSGRWTGFDRQALCGFLDHEAADAALFVFAPAGLVFEPEGLLRLAAALEDGPAMLVFADLDLTTADGLVQPSAFGAFDAERCLEQGHAALVFAATRAALTAVLASSEAEDQPGLFLALLAQQDSAARVVHLPGSVGGLPPIDIEAATTVLLEATRAHLAARDSAASVTRGQGDLLPAVHVRRPAAAGSTSIILCVRDQGEALARSLASIGPVAARAGATILIVDNGSQDDATQLALRDARRQGHDIATCAGVLNLARLRNNGADLADGARLLFLEPGLEAASDDWLDELESRAAGPGVAAVGAMVAHASGLVRQAGLVIGPGFGVAPAFADRLETEPGWCDLLRVAHEVAALQASALLVNRDDFTAVGGFDEANLPLFDHDVDLCLKLRARGGRLILAPRALLGGRGDGPDHDREPWRALAARERDAVRRRWGEALSGDPFYSPILAPTATPYSALRWGFASEPLVATAPVRAGRPVRR